MENQKIENQKLPFEEVTEITEKLLKNTKIVNTENKTGISYFEGKNRFIKILSTKKLIKVEINVQLDPEFEKLPEITAISPDMAYKKHLGTLKYYLQTNDAKFAKEIIKNALKNFKK